MCSTGLHTEFACHLYSMLKKKLSPEIINEIIGDAVKMEKAFILDALPCALIGMNSAMMSDYIEVKTQRHIVNLKQRRIC